MSRSTQLGNSYVEQTNKKRAEVKKANWITCYSTYSYYATYVMVYQKAF